MLYQIRETLGGKIALAILFVLAVSFVFFGVNMSFTSAGYLAKVNGEAISIFEVQQLYQNQASQYREQLGSLPAELDRQLQQMAVDQVITGTAVRTYLDDAGYRVHDDIVEKSIKEIPVFHNDDGIFERQIYRDFLAARGIPVTQFENDQRDNLRIAQLQQGIAETAFVTPAELRREIELVNETREYTAAVLERSRFVPEAEPSDEEIAAFYEDNPGLFQTEDSASISYVELTREAVAGKVEVTDDVLEEYFESVAASFEMPAERNPRHILIPVDDDEDAARTLADDLKRQIDEGADFAELAKEYSKDGGSAVEGGDLGWVRQGQFVGPVDDAVFAMEEGEVRGPVLSEFGYHIIRLDGIREKRVPPLAEVRDRVERQYREDQAAQRFLSVSNALADALFDNPDLDELAASENLEIGTFDTFTRADGVMFANNEEVMSAVFGDDAVRGAALSDLIEVADDRQVIIRVNEFRPAATRPLGDVRAEIVERINLQRASEALEDAVEDLLARARSAGSLSDAVVDSETTIGEAVTIERNAADVSPALRAAVFDAPSPEDGVPVFGQATEANGDAVVFELGRVIPGRVTELSVADRDNRRRRLAERDGLSDFGAFVAFVRDSADVKLGSAQVFTTDDQL